jgi:hypothetical protein
MGKIPLLKTLLFVTMMFLRGVAQLGLERLVRDQEVAGSNPVTPIKTSN